jgi:hypothetical protein
VVQWIAEYLVSTVIVVVYRYQLCQCSATGRVRAMAKARPTAALESATGRVACCSMPCSRYFAGVVVVVVVVVLDFDVGALRGHGWKFHIRASFIRSIATGRSCCCCCCCGCLQVYAGRDFASGRA